MNDMHLNEQDLMLAALGDEIEAPSREHLASCADCTAKVAEWKQVLALVEAPEAPERPYGFELRMWNAVEQRIAEKETTSGWLGQFSSLTWRAWAMGSVAAAVILAAFLLGRFTSQPAIHTPANDTAKTEQRKEVLQVALADHLEDSQRLLVELTHAKDTGTVADASKRAEDLLESNRLYRQTAQQNGDKNVAQVLDQLERVLMEVAHEGDRPSADEQQQVAEQAQQNGLMFKVRVMASAARQGSRQDRANTGSKGQKI